MLRAGRCTVPGKFMAWGGSWLETCWKLNAENVMLSSMFDKVAMYLAYIWPIIYFLKMEGASSAKIVWSLRHQKNAFSSSDVAHLFQIHFSNQAEHRQVWLPRYLTTFRDTQAAVSSCDAADHLIQGFHRCRGTWDAHEWTDMKCFQDARFKIFNFKVKKISKPFLITAGDRSESAASDTRSGWGRKKPENIQRFCGISIHFILGNLWTLLETFKLSSNLEFG